MKKNNLKDYILNKIFEFSIIKQKNFILYFNLKFFNYISYLIYILNLFMFLKRV